MNFYNANLPLENYQMKCMYCEKPATFHITELTGPDGPKVVHLCEEHFREYLAGNSESPASALTNILAKQLKMDTAAKELAAADQKTCPVCGISFAEFRKGGRLGCAYDYIAFEDDLEPLLINIHGALGHVGKTPKNLRGSPERQRQVAELKEEMMQAVKKEQYERAGELRDQITAIEANFGTDEPPTANTSEESSDEDFQKKPE